MVEAAGAGPSSWPSFGLGELVKQVDAAREEGKYLFIWDKQGSVETFFTYQGKVSSFSVAKLNASLGRATKEDGLEIARKAVVNCLRNGDRLLYDFDKIAVDLTNEWTDEKIFPSAMILNREEYLKKDNYMKIVKDEENTGIGGLNPGYYIASPNFSMTFRSGATDEADVTKLLSGLPNNEQFKTIIIE